MTDKQIIIDGINVAECEYYTQDYQRANNIEGRYEHCKDVCELIGDNYFYCKMNNNCYYKQLKRKEQECEEKQKIAQDIKSKLCVEKSALYNELDKLKAEFNKKELIFEGIETSNRLLIEKIEKIKKQKEKLEQAITEIKEIAKNMNEECFYDDFDCMNCDMQNGCTYLNKKQILQKISECEVLK